MSAPNINPNHVYAVSAGATAVSWISNLDTFLHIVASLAVILTVVATYVRSLKDKK